MLGVDFIYGDKWLSEFDMMMCDPKDEQAFVSRNIDRSDITSARPTPFHFGVTYSDTLKIYLFIVKNDEIVENKKLFEEEINDLRAWLESPKNPTELIVIFDSDDDTVHYYGLFSDVQPFTVAGNCYGLYLTFTCNSPYGFTDDNVMTYEIAASGKTEGEYNNMSAEYSEYLMPKITIISSSTFGASESLSIKNLTDNNNTMSLNLPQGKTGIILDCKNKIATDTNGNLLPLSVLGFSDISTYSSILNLSNFYWLSFIAGNNRLEFTPSNGHTITDIEIRAKQPVKVGGF